MFINMEQVIRKYLSQIGRRGGMKSRRFLDSETARNMVRLREARRAYRRYYAQCFWSCDPSYAVNLEDIPWIADQLQRYGGRAGFALGARLCR